MVGEGRVRAVGADGGGEAAEAEREEGGTGEAGEGGGCEEVVFAAGQAQGWGVVGVVGAGEAGGNEIGAALTGVGRCAEEVVGKAAFTD